ncbi:DUF3265 domain-containing protein [Aliivibrio fischeri]|nr:DUF3265 domain-containing protein [Aliivibrio fischeri]MCE7588446.1 DUF3265 domain-containing protein [Aliivibrio fischeri]
MAFLICVDFGVEVPCRGLVIVCFTILQCVRRPFR